MFQQRKDNFAGFTKWQMCDQSVAAVQTEWDEPEHLDSAKIRASPTLLLNKSMTSMLGNSVDLNLNINYSGFFFSPLFTMNYHFNGFLTLFVLSLSEKFLHICSSPPCVFHQGQAEVVRSLFWLLDCSLGLCCFFSDQSHDRPCNLLRVYLKSDSLLLLAFNRKHHEIKERCEGGFMRI